MRPGMLIYYQYLTMCLVRMRLTWQVEQILMLRTQVTLYKLYIIYLYIVTMPARLYLYVISVMCHVY